MTTKIGRNTFFWLRRGRRRNEGRRKQGRMEEESRQRVVDAQNIHTNL